VNAEAVKAERHEDELFLSGSKECIEYLHRFSCYKSSDVKINVWECIEGPFN